MMARQNQEDFDRTALRSREKEEEEKFWPAHVPGAAMFCILTGSSLHGKRSGFFFESLPITFGSEKEGYPAFTCCHGSPVDTRELLQLDSDRTKEVLEEIDTDYTACQPHARFPGISRYPGKNLYEYRFLWNCDGRFRDTRMPSS